MGVGRLSRPLRGLVVLAMLDAGLDATRRVECVCKIPPGAGGLRMLITGMAAGVFIDRRSVADGLETTG
jgi:hypothetical protein